MHSDEFNECVVYIEADNSSGTGTVITEDGCVLTCAHVVENKESIYVEVSLSDERQVLKADMIYCDSENDLAVVKLECGKFKHAGLLPEGEKSRNGDDIVILGYPFGTRVSDDVMEMNLSFTKGYVSSMQRINGRDCALLDISAKAGNSGSPVIDADLGVVVGVLCGSITNQNRNLTEEINYMRPISCFWSGLSQ